MLHMQPQYWNDVATNKNVREIPVSQLAPLQICDAQYCDIFGPKVSGTANMSESITWVNKYYLIHYNMRNKGKDKVW